MEAKEILEPRSGTVSDELPCGFVEVLEKGDPRWNEDNNGVIVHKEFIVDDMDGEDEDILAGTGPLVTRLNRVIFNRTLQIGDIVDRKLIAQAINRYSTSDRMTALVAIRMATAGEIFRFPYECPNCKHEDRAELDLRNLEKKHMKEPETRRRTDVLPTGIEIEWHVMDGRDEEFLQEINKEDKKNESRLTNEILSRIDRIGDFKVERTSKGGLRAAVQRVKKLKTRDRNYLRTLFDVHEGSIDTKIEMTCSSCKHDWNRELPVGSKDFFFPPDESIS